MAKTPEGKVKARLKAFLNQFEYLYQFWPVQNGMGQPTLDVIVCYKGFYLAIEAKPGKKQMTERQTLTAEDMRGAQGCVLLINDEAATWRQLATWIDTVDQMAQALAGVYAYTHRIKEPAAAGQGRSTGDGIAGKPM